MRMRKLLLTTVLCSGLMAGASTNCQAQANSTETLNPNSDWAVSQLAASQIGGQPYCALARRFNNNMILTMARNSRDEGSVAIDFQQSRLNSGQTYYVTLDPGFGKERAFNVRPVSGRALVIRMGKDYEFTDAMNKSGKLKIDVSGKTYAFNLPSLSNGERRLGECLAQLIEPAAGPGAVQSMTPLPAAPVQSSYIPASASAPPRPAGPGASTTVAPLPVSDSPDSAAHGNDIDKLREENTRLRNALERERRVYEDRYMQDSQGSSVSAELNEKIRLLEMENKQLKQQVSYQPAPEPQNCPTPDTAALDSIKKQLAALQDENSHLKAAASAQSSSGDELAQLRDENLSLKQDLAAMKTRNAMLEQQIAANKTAAAANTANTADIQDLQARLDKLQEENQKLKADNASYAKGGADVPVSLAQLRSVEEQLRHVQGERDKLRQQISDVNQGKRKDLLDISSKNWDLEQATRRFNEAEREIERLGRQLEDEKTKCATDKKKLEYMLFDPTVAKKEQISKLVDLEGKVKTAQATLDDQKSSYEQKLASLQKQSEAAQQSMNIQKAEYDQKMAVLKQEIASRGQASDATKQRVAALEKQLAQKAAEAKDTETQIAMLQSKVEQARTSASQQASSQLVAIRQERDELAQQKTDVDAENKRLNDTIALLEKQLDTVQASAADAQQAVNDPAKDQKIAQLQQENATLSSQRDRLEHERSMLEDKQGQLTDKIASLEAALSNIQTAAGGPASLPDPVASEPVPTKTYKMSSTGHMQQYPKPATPQAQQAPAPQYNEAQQLEQQEQYQSFGKSVQKSVEPAVAPSSAKLMSASALKSILDQAQVPVQGKIKKVDSGKGDIVAYSWDTGVLFGSAEQRPLGSADQFDKLAQSYIQQTKSRCQGDFAAVPVTDTSSGGTRISAYEIACVNGGDGAAASLVFHSDGKVFTTIAHETGLNSMDTAMDVRDRLVGTLMQGRIVSR